MKQIIMVVLIDKRSTSAPAVQQILTKFGSAIKVRLGLHELQEGDENGQILLQLKTNDETIAALTHELSALDLVRVKTMPLD